MRKKGAKGAPTAANFRRAKKFKVYDHRSSKMPICTLLTPTHLCAGKIKDPSGGKKKSKGRKPSAMGGRIKLCGGLMTRKKTRS